MKTFVIAGKHQVYFEEVPEPEINGTHDVKVRVKACGICGTDNHIFEGEHDMSRGQLRIPGHEFAGVVVETGSEVSSVAVGDRVVHEPICYCGTCYACRNQQGNVCANVQVSGCNMSGGWQEYYVADEKQWHHIPDWMTWDLAAMVEPYTIAAQVCTRAELKPDDVVLIHGGGPIGLMVGDTAGHLGAKVILTEILEGRIKLAKEIGINHVIDASSLNVKEEVMKITNGEGPNVVLDCAGLPQMAEEALEILTPAGRFVPVAASNFVCNGRLIHRKQLKIIGSRLQMNQFQPVLARFGLYRENALKLITHRYSFEESKEAFGFASERQPNTGKVVVLFS